MGGGGNATPPTGFLYASHHHSEFFHLILKTMSYICNRDDLTFTVALLLQAENI